MLLNLEGGMGDQIHGVRWAKDIAKRGCRVVVSCTLDLAPLFVDVEGVSAIVDHGHALAVHHDYWLPSMSAIVALGYEYGDLDGSPYIPSPREAQHGRVGLRWSGNPTFEHEQHRLFPAELMFEAVRGMDCVSLQKGEGADLRPDWVKEVPLDTWQDTAKAIASCELVVTSCTSVAHLSAAMGVPTWIVTPILAYYLWALPGSSTPYYDAVTLFRQETYGDWAHPFMEIRHSIGRVT